MPRQRVITPPALSAQPWQLQSVFRYDHQWCSGGLMPAVRELDQPRFEVIRDAIRISRQILGDPKSLHISAWALSAEPEDIYDRPEHEAANDPTPVVTMQGSPDSFFLAQVQAWYNGNNHLILLDRGMSDNALGQTWSDHPEYAHINLSLLDAACEAYRYEWRGDLFREQYRCHAVHLGLVIAHEAQHSMRYSIPAATRPTPPKLKAMGHPTNLLDKEDPRSMRRGEGGLFWEQSLFGGVVIREAPPSTSYPGEIEALVVFRRATQDHLHLTPKQISYIYDGPEGWSDFLPVKATHENRFLPGKPARSLGRFISGNVEDSTTQAAYHLIEGGCEVGVSRSLSLSSVKRETDIFDLSPHGVRIEQQTGRGRGVFANRAFIPGETIYPVTSRPPASVLSSQGLTTHCSACFLSARDAAILQGKEEEPLKRCSACRVTHYCSTACSRDDWIYHKPECSAFQLLRQRHKEKFPDTKAGNLDFIPHESVRALGRLLWTKKRAKEAGTDCTSWDEYCLLQSNIDPEADKLAKLREQAYRLAYYIGLASPHLLEAGSEMALTLLLKDYGIEGKLELELIKLLSRYQTNAFTLDSPDLYAVGVAVAPALAMANHSCEPNAVVVFPKGKGLGQITAVRPIAPDEEVLVCYIDVASPYSARQSELSDRYGFTCDCGLCHKEEEESWVDPRWSVLHPGCSSKGKGRMPQSISWTQSISWNEIRLKPSCIGRQVSFAESVDGETSASRCDACGQAFAADKWKLVDLLGRAKGLLEADENGSLDAAAIEMSTEIDNARTITTQLLSICPSLTHPLIPLNRLLTRLLTINPPTSVPSLSTPLHHLTLALEGARTIYTAHHPTLAILLAQKARLLGIQFPLTDKELSGGRSSDVARSEMQRMQAALIAYREAVKACQGCFGRDGGIVGMGLQAEMEGLEREISAMRIVTIM